jgi:hypothetical protein
MTDRRLDDVIDRAVREMMNVDPPLSVRTRVLARLDRPDPRVVTWPRIAVAGAAALLLALAIVRVPRPGPTTGIPAGPAPVTVPLTRGSDKSSVAPETNGQAQLAPRATPSRRGPTVSTATAITLPASIPALVDIAPLVVVPPQPLDIEPGAITIAPLDVPSDLHVEPLPFPHEWRD